MAKRKGNRIQFRINEDLKARYFTACEYRDTDPSQDLNRHIVAFTREAEKEMREKGILKTKATGE